MAEDIVDEEWGERFYEVNVNGQPQVRVSRW